MIAFVSALEAAVSSVVAASVLAASVLAASVLAGDLTWLEEGVIDPSEGTGPWIARWEPGPSTQESTWRAVR